MRVPARSDYAPPRGRYPLQGDSNASVLEVAVGVEPALEVRAISNQMVRAPTSRKFLIAPLPGPPLEMALAANVVVHAVKMDKPEVGIPLDSAIGACMKSGLPLQRNRCQRRLPIGIVGVPVPALPQDRMVRVVGRLDVSLVNDLVSQAVDEVFVEPVDVVTERSEAGGGRHDLVDVCDQHDVVTLHELVLVRLNCAGHPSRVDGFVRNRDSDETSS